MSKLQYDILFSVFVAGAIFLMLAKSVFGLEIEPIALTGYGALTTFVLTQRKQWTDKAEQAKVDARIAAAPTDEDVV